MNAGDRSVWLLNAEMGQGTVFVFCDDESHESRSPVFNFRRDPRMGWLPGGAAGRSNVTTLSDGLGGYRYRFRLACGRPGCRTRVVEARADKIFPVLDRVVSGGVSELSLSALAASLAVQERMEDYPRASQGPTEG